MKHFKDNPNVLTQDEKPDSQRESKDKEFEKLKNLLQAIEQFVTTINEHPMLLRYSRRRKCREDKSLLWVDKLIDEFIHFAQHLQTCHKLYPLKRFPVLVDIFQEHLDSWFEYGIPDEPDLAHRQRIMHCIYHIHQTMQLRENRQNLRRIKRRYENQEDVILELLDRLFDCHSKLLVLRIELGYGKDYKASLPRAKKDLEKFLDYLRESHEHLVGYVWKMEYGLQKGYHFHVLIMLDGQKAWGDVTYGRVMCDHWIKRITKGQGTAYNCNGNRQGYRECYLGIVRYDALQEKGKRTFLEKHSLYLAKPDPLVEVAMLEEFQAYRNEGSDELVAMTRNAREFGASIKPPLPEQLRGRPRLR